MQPSSIGAIAKYGGSTAGEMWFTRCNLSRYSILSIAGPATAGGHSFRAVCCCLGGTPG